MITLVLALAAVTPDDPNYNFQAAAFDAIRLPEAWDVTTGGNQRIGVVDTGLVRGHTDFDLDAGWNFLGDNDAFDDTAPGTLSHGSHVAGTVAALGDNGAGVSGVHWAATLAVARSITTEGEGTDVTIMQGARWLAGLDSTENAPNLESVDVINMSLGIPGGCTPQMQSDVDDILGAGVVIVAASGNHGPDFGGVVDDDVFGPAACDGVVSVGAFDGPDFAQTAYTNDDGRVDLLAPGGTSALGIASYGSAPNAIAAQQGTSMASPHVAGVVALMLDVNPDLTPAQVRAILLSLPRKNGHVVLDAAAAIAAAESGEPLPAETPLAGGCAQGGGGAHGAVALVLLGLVRRRRR